MSILRGNHVLGALALVLALAGSGWAQTPPPAASAPADLYRRAVTSLEQAEQQLNAGNIVDAKTQARQANALFTLLQKDSAKLLEERKLTPQEEQQLAITQKLADDTQTEAERLMASARDKEKQGRELAAQGKGEASQASYRASREDYHQAQILSIKSLIHALHNQQQIFQFLGP
ncbi:MAG: hypothetical protein M0P73_15550 [Syntrophobacterales bacterium]|jgi:hypothetical protein|nr:hypothetical protein [Syntrophobacterales bacterium]